MANWRDPTKEDYELPSRLTESTERTTRDIRSIKKILRFSLAQYLTAVAVFFLAFIGTYKISEQLEKIYTTVYKNECLLKDLIEARNNQISENSRNQNRRIQDTAYEESVSSFLYQCCIKPNIRNAADAVTKEQLDNAISGQKSTDAKNIRAISMSLVYTIDYMDGKSRLRLIDNEQISDEIEALVFKRIESYENITRANKE